MNIEAIKRTRDLIASQPELYNQEKWGHDCGTPACIAGFACVANGGKLRQRLNYGVKEIVCVTQRGTSRTVRQYAARKLGLPMGEADMLFAANPLFHRPATHEDAIATLDRMIETGQIDWHGSIS